MGSSNDFFKLITVFCVIAWAMFQFRSRSEDSLVYNNGDPIRTGGTVNNLNEGIWTWYHPNGEIQLTGKFVKGKREGVWKSYDSLGNVLIISTYKNNLLNGSFKLFDSNGDIEKEVFYVNDKIQL